MKSLVVFGWIASFCFSVSYIPQLLKILKTKQVNDISIGFLIFTLVAYICGLIYGLSIYALPVIFSHVIGLIFLTWFLILYYKYRGTQPCIK